MLQGSLVSLVTPMRGDGTLDLNSFDKLIEWHINQGTQAFVILDTTGEAVALSAEEKAMIIRKVLEVTKNRIPVIAGTGCASTSDTVRLTKHASELGVDACLVVTPYYNRPTQEGLYLHYELVAKSVDVPIILYNEPNRTGCDLLPATVAQLAAIPNIIGLKETNGGIERIKELRDYCNGAIQLYSGDDTTACDFIFGSADGVISVTANLAPSLMHHMCDAALDGRRDEATELQQQLAPLHQALLVGSSPIAVKWALHAMGLIPSGIRLPLTSLDSRFHDELRNRLNDLDIFDTLLEKQNEVIG